MKINLEEYYKGYHKAGKYQDNFQSGIKTLPYNSTTVSAFDKKCGIQGTTGEFFRLLEHDGTKPIDDFETSAILPVMKYLTDTRQMEPGQANEYVKILKDILLVNGNLNVTDSAFLKYIPLVPNDENITSKEQKVYSDGQKKLANFLYSMTSDTVEQSSIQQKKNLFVKILRESLTDINSGKQEQAEHEYKILPFIQNSFVKDLNWLLQQEESVKVKYIHLLLHFYACYAVSQTIVHLSSKIHEENGKPAPFYFILNSEKSSANHDAVTRGWNYQIPKPWFDKVYGRAQALDILNCVLGGNIGFYPDIYKALSTTPFEENKESCDELLKVFQEEKRAMIGRRGTEDELNEEIDLTINSYDEFVEKLERLCIVYQSASYVPRMRKKVTDLMSVRFLQIRRGLYILTIDNEMLTFLIAMLTQSKKVKLEDMYKRFNDYGIFFNRGSRMAIEEYLLKLNLLDRKSDSGEAQYVKVVL